MSTINPLTNSETVEDKQAHTTTVSKFAQLQRVLVKLVFSFCGRTPDIDQRLMCLAATLKRVPRCFAAITEIEDIVAQLLVTESANKSPTFSAREVVELLGQLQFEGEAPVARSLQRRLSEVTTLVELNRLIREAGDLINQQLKTSAPAATTSRSVQQEEPLSRLLGALKTSGALTDALQQLRSRAEYAQSHGSWLEAAEEAAATLSSALAIESVDAGVDEIELARQPLLRFLDSLQGNEAEREELSAARAQLSAARGPTEIIIAARALGGVLRTQRASLELVQKELSGFISTVALRIEEFRSQLNRSGDTHRASVLGAVEIHSVMQFHMGQIKERVVDESEISLLKSFVLDELNQLETVVSEKTKVQSERHKDACERVTGTLQRLAELESDVANLRHELEEQHTLRLIDPLTGVYNRLGYLDGIAREYARWKRQGGALSLAIFDLDHFKQVNDRFGHAAGDKVLTSFAALLRKHVRGSDLICRFGGEEFVLLMPETELEGAALLCEKLRKVLADRQFRFKDTPVPVTISCGYAMFRGEDSVDEVFERADSALYRAKDLGRNRCCAEQA
ncbi:MAG: GGDEF domain-containing protein [Gammaproteobacteria bacterium]|nr:GGDEF domain-containing protein [Gammaproteobacteria bacterium]